MWLKYIKDDVLKALSIPNPCVLINKSREEENSIILHDALKIIMADTHYTFLSVAGLEFIVAHLVISKPFYVFIFMTLLGY